jgi:hypothetical protein
MASRTRDPGTTCASAGRKRWLAFTVPNRGYTKPVGDSLQNDYARQSEVSSTLRWGKPSGEGCGSRNLFYRAELELATHF